MLTQCTTPTVDPDGLQRLIRAYRRLQNLKPKEIEKNLKQKLTEPSDADALQWLVAKKDGESLSEADMIKRLEVQKIPKDLELSNVRPIANIYSIPTLMLPPLLAKPCDDNELKHSLEEFVPIDLQGTKAERAVYKVFGRRLIKTDAVFVHLHLQKGGKADIHRHPGDELIYVRAGEVRFHARSLGYRPYLKKGDIIHFHADLEHTVTADR